MAKIYVIIGESGLNGHWVEAVRELPMDTQELDESLRMSGAPTGFGGFYTYEIDTEPPYTFREVG